MSFGEVRVIYQIAIVLGIPRRVLVVVVIIFYCLFFFIFQVNMTTLSASKATLFDYDYYLLLFYFLLFLLCFVLSCNSLIFF